jgi:hypothetical protein
MGLASIQVKKEVRPKISSAIRVNMENTVMKRVLKWASAVSALAFSMGVQAEVIDLFSEPDLQRVLTDGITTTDFDQAGNYPDTIIGGYRDLYLVETDNPNNNVNTMQVSSSTNRLSVSAGSQANITGTVQWDGNDNDPSLDYTGLGGVDLVNQEGCPSGGCDSFSFLIFSSDAGQDGVWYFTIGLYTDDKNYTEFDLLATQVTSGEDPVLSVLLFSDFTEDEGNNSCGQIGGFDNPAVLAKRCGDDGTVDVTDLGAIQVIFNIDAAGLPGDQRTVDLDLTIGAITKTGEVPEPGILGLMGLSLAVLGLVRIRNRKGNA